MSEGMTPMIMKNIHGKEGNTIQYYSL